MATAAMVFGMHLQALVPAAAEAFLVLRCARDPDVHGTLAGCRILGPGAGGDGDGNAREKHRPQREFPGGRMVLKRQNLFSASVLIRKFVRFGIVRWQFAVMRCRSV